MFFEVILNDTLINYYSNKFESLIKRDFTKEELLDNETKYLFWLISIKEEIDNFDKTSKKYYETKVIFDEAINMIEQGKPRKTDKGIYNIIVYYEIINELIVYIGSVYYKIDTEEGTVYNINNNNEYLRTDSSQKILFFLSIYKSNINICTTCSEKSFSTQMLSYLENIAINNNCVCLYTTPIGIMNTILINNGFLNGIVKPLSITTITNNKKFSIRNSIRNLFKNNRKIIPTTEDENNTGGKKKKQKRKQKQRRKTKKIRS